MADVAATLNTATNSRLRHLVASCSFLNSTFLAQTTRIKLALPQGSRLSINGKIAPLQGTGIKDALLRG